VIVAQGYMGRTTMSCDDGKTWINDRSFDKEGHERICYDKSPVICGVTSCSKMALDGTCYIQKPCDCAHGSGYPKGISIAQSQILSNFGWGNPPVIMRSQDGLTWDSSFHPAGGSPNLVYGAGRYIRYDSTSLISEDGMNWRNGGFANFNGPDQVEVTTRAFEFLDYMGGRFIGMMDGNNIRVTADRGDTWFTPKTIPPDCTYGVGRTERFLTGNGIAVMITDNRKACRSADGGVTWTLHDITTQQTGMMFQHGVFSHGKFLTWGLMNGIGENGSRYSSVDGITWVEARTNGPIWLGPVGVTLAGTLVATNGNGEYAHQTFMRSTDDGLTWIELPLGAFEQSHAIMRYGSGMIPANNLCPAR
jgi:hypothetical protein